MDESLRYGEYTIDGRLNCMLDEHIRFSIYRSSYDKYVYERYEDDELIKKRFITVEDILKISILPVTPQNVPAKYTNHMMVVLSDSIILNKNNTTECYLVIPIEIGIIIDNHIIDAYSLGYTKYALYGLPQRGIICRYAKSSIYTEIPRVDQFREAIVRSVFKNYSSDIKVINRLVFPIESANLYYDDSNTYFDMVDATLETKLNIDILTVRVLTIEWNAKKTSLGKEFNNIYTMEWGY